VKEKSGPEAEPAAKRTEQRSRPDSRAHNALLQRANHRMRRRGEEEGKRRARREESEERWLPRELVAASERVEEAGFGLNQGTSAR